MSEFKVRDDIAVHDTLIRQKERKGLLRHMYLNFKYRRSHIFTECPACTRMDALVILSMQPSGDRVKTAGHAPQ